MDNKMCYSDLMKTKKLELSQILKAIEDEPEYPGELPLNLRLTLESAIEEKDMDLLVALLRITVILTKLGIAKRVKELA